MIRYDVVDQQQYSAMRERLVAAFVASLIIHLALYGGWRLGERLGLWSHQATWLLDWNKAKAKKVARVPVPPPAATLAEPPPKEIPLTFVEVDPTVAAPEAPKDAKYYGALNAQAANPEVKIEAPVPNADGKQDKVPRMADVTKPNPFPLQPSPKPEPVLVQPVEPPSVTPPSTPPPGDMAKAITKDLPDTVKIDKPPEIKPIVKPEPRPRTLEEARNRLGLVGQTLKEEGGTKRKGTLTFDVRATEFGAYDAAFIAAVQKRWYDLLDSSGFVQRSGKVVLEFRLTYDGRITDMRVGDNNDVGELLALLCQRAVQDPAPFAPWPADMRRRIGHNHRDVTFTFYYN